MLERLRLCVEPLGFALARHDDAANTPVTSQNKDTLFFIPVGAGAGAGADAAQRVHGAVQVLAQCKALQRLTSTCAFVIHHARYARVRRWCGGAVAAAVR